MNSPIVLLNQNSQVGTNTVVEIDNRFHTFAAYITTSSDWVNGTFTATMEISDNANFTGNWINFGGPIYNLAANSIYSLSFGGVFIPIIRARIITGQTQGSVNLNLFFD